MAKIVLRLVPDTTQVSLALQNLKKEADSLNGKKVDLGIDAKQANAIASAARALASLQRAQNQAAAAQNKYNIETARAEKETAKFGQQIEKTKQAQERSRQTEERTTQARERTTQATLKAKQEEEKTAQAREKTTQATEKTKQAEEKTAQARERTAQATEKTRQEELKLEQQHERTASAATGVTAATSAYSVALGTIAARAFHVVIRKITQAFRESLQTMREVDQELANIQKVTDESDAVIEKIGDTAYETASKYGVAANEYLEAAGVFAKAGYDNYTTMAELATKTQLVGDVTAEVASKFLLSADAAWKFNGNMEDLSQVLDKANTIENNYATSIEKLAQGLPLVASTAAMAGMSVDETLAALGTITAKTQESGTMAARALRALILNILKDTETEIEEGVTWSENEIKSLNDLLWKYANEAMRTAQENGGVVNPMEAIRALHDAYAEGLLTQKELTDLAMDLGGKLRTNQLLALITNLETFDEMLGKTAESAGSADKEIEVMLGTWNAKVNILKNTWTDFVKELVDTDFIKGGIDVITDAVGGLGDALKRLNDPFYEVNQLKGTYDTLQAEYSDLVSKGDDLTTTERTRLELLERQLAVIRAQADAEEWSAAKKLQRQLTATGMGNVALDFGNAFSMRAKFEGVGFTGDIAEYQSGLRQIVSDYSDYYSKVIQVRDAGIEITDNQKQFIADYEDIAVAAEATGVRVGQLVDGYYSLVDANGKVVAYAKDMRADLEAEAEAVEKRHEADVHDAELTQARSEALDAWMEYEHASAEERDAAYQNWIEKQTRVNELLGVTQTDVESIDFTNAINDAGTLANELERAASAASQIAIPEADIPHMASGGVSGGGKTLVNELGPELISDNGRAYIANGGKPAVVNLHRGSIVIPAKQTRVALRGGMPTRAAAAGQWQGNFPADNANGVTAIGLIGSAIIGAAGLNGDIGGQTPEVVTWSGRGGSGASKPNVEKLAKELSDLLSNLDKQAKLAGNEGDYVRQAEIYEQAQEAIKKMVDDYRAAGYADDSDEILDLLNKNYDYANKQLTLYQTKWDELIAALDADTSAQEVANKLAEKQQAVEDAREALANAQKQRTVRIYNSATGQWEWVADQSKVQSAEKALDTAESNYTDTVKSEALAELKRLKETATDLTEVVLGPALSTVAMMAESTAEFQAFARALNAVYGVGSFLGSTEGSNSVISTTDSHDTIYTFGNISLTSEQAQSMTVAQLAQQLQVLGLTS